MKLGSLFDGIGGFPYSAQRHGITPVWASEIEPAAVSITKRHFPGMKHLGDITKINGAEIEPVDLITFGSPCQDLSVAGKRAGLDGERSGLFGEAIRIIDEMRKETDNEYPRFAIWENVPGALSSNKGLDFKAVLEAFTKTEIPMPKSNRWASAGMVRGGRCNIAWRILDAKYWGVPQRRRRIFLVADFRGERAAEILFKPESLRGYFAPCREARQKTAGFVGNGVEGANGGIVLNDQGGERMGVPEGVVGTLRAEIHRNTPCVVVSNGVTESNIYVCQTSHTSSNGLGVSENVVYTLDSAIGQAVFDCCGNGDGEAVCALTNGHQNRVTNCTAIVVNDYGGERVDVLSDVTGTLRAQTHRHEQIAFAKQTFGEYKEDTTFTTQTARCNISGACDVIVSTIDWRNHVENIELSNGIARRLLPVECERLQGFPDNWTAYGHDDKPISNTKRYAAIGNSVAIPCVDYVIQGLIETI